MQSISVKAYAKINLGLLITGKRPDGYHTLETVFAPINWYDELTLSPSQEVRMSCTNQDLPCDDSNLCIRAAKALRDFSGASSGVEIGLAKHIPFGAGLGGGSSDAASTLRVLNRMWNINASSHDLHRIAVGLGADVPYFLESGGLAYAAGIGEELEDLELTLPFSIVTLFPGDHISTVWAYRNFYACFEREIPDLKGLVRSLCQARDTSVLEVFDNDFEPVVFDHYPAVREAKDALVQSGSFFASLSGSGSAVFGLFENDSDAERAAEQLSATYRARFTPASFAMA